MTISVVVCCSNDFDISKMIDSIRAQNVEGVEIIGAITPNAVIEGYLNSLNIPYALTPRGNHGATANAGMARATKDKILLVDSDCVLDDGALTAVDTALDSASVVNLPIRFESTGGWLSKAIASCRHFDNTYSAAAYKPGIAFRSEVRNIIGGYWYDERIRWPCDSEMLWRLRDRDVAIAFLKSPCIAHRPIPLRHALRAYYSYGMDGCRRVSCLGQTTHLIPISNLIAKLRSLLKAARLDRGLLLNLVFDAVYIAGYLRERARSGRGLE